MTDKSLEMLKWLLEDLETDEGVCYKTRSSTCATACPLWYAGAFGDNICLPSVLGRRVTRMIHDQQLPKREKENNNGIQGNETIQKVQPDSLTRVDVLRRAEECVCGHREQDYGSPEDNFEAIADFWETYLNRGCLANDGRVHLDASDVAMMMALFKIARIATGTGTADSFIDLAGYAACGGECAGV